MDSWQKYIFIDDLILIITLYFIYQSCNGTFLTGVQLGVKSDSLKMNLK